MTARWYPLIAIRLYFRNGTVSGQVFDQPRMTFPKIPESQPPERWELASEYPSNKQSVQQKVRRSN